MELCPAYVAQLQACLARPGTNFVETAFNAQFKCLASDAFSCQQAAVVALNAALDDARDHLDDAALDRLAASPDAETLNGLGLPPAVADALRPLVIAVRAAVDRDALIKAAGARVVMRSPPAGLTDDEDRARFFDALKAINELLAKPEHMDDAAAVAAALARPTMDVTAFGRRIPGLSAHARTLRVLERKAQQPERGSKRVRV